MAMPSASTTHPASSTANRAGSPAGRSQSSAAIARSRQALNSMFTSICSSCTGGNFLLSSATCSRISIPLNRNVTCPIVSGNLWLNTYATPAMGGVPSSARVTAATPKALIRMPAANQKYRFPYRATAIPPLPAVKTAAARESRVSARKLWFCRTGRQNCEAPKNRKNRLVARRRNAGVLCGRQATATQPAARFC